MLFWMLFYVHYHAAYIRTDRMKTLTRILFFLFLVAGLHASESWGTDYPAALEQASQEKKLVLLDFTGSDWCHWCQKLQGDVFSQAAFKDFAKKNLVLVELDFPQGKIQSEKLKSQNQALQTQYHVEGYPTLVLLDAKGKVIKQHTGSFDSPAAFVAWVGDKL